MFKYNSPHLNELLPKLYIPLNADVTSPVIADNVGIVGLSVKSLYEPEVATVANDFQKAGPELPEVNTCPKLPDDPLAVIGPVMFKPLKYRNVGLSVKSLYEPENNVGLSVKSLYEPVVATVAKLGLLVKFV